MSPLATDPAGRGTGGGRRRAARWPLLLVLPLLLLAVAELVLRATDVVELGKGSTREQIQFNEAGMFVEVEDPRLSYRNKPLASTTVGGIRYAHDDRGRRLVPSQFRKPLPGVAFLGDSTTYGLGVAAEHSLPAQVAARLGHAIRPLNLGVNGYTTAQALQLYREEHDQLGDTPVVVLVWFPNDMAPAPFRWDEGSSLMYLDRLPLPRGLRKTLWNVELYRALVSWHGGRLVDAGWGDPNVESNWGPSLAALAQLAEEVSDAGRTLLVAALPAMESLDPYLFEAPLRAVERRCAELGLPFVDLLPPFLAEREREMAAYERAHGAPADEVLVSGFLSRYWVHDPLDHHLNAEATALAADELARALTPLLELDGP